jgi:hypothetical protein
MQKKNNIVFYANDWKVGLPSRPMFNYKTLNSEFQKNKTNKVSRWGNLTR